MEIVELHPDALAEIQALANARATAEAQLQTLINATLWALGKKRTNYANVQFADGCLELHPLAVPPTPPGEGKKPQVPAQITQAVKTATKGGGGDAKQASAG